MRRIHGVEDILLGFEPKDAGSIPAGSVFFKKSACDTPKMRFLQNFLRHNLQIDEVLKIRSEIRYSKLSRLGKYPAIAVKT
jgi:hypothetical protein